MKNKLLILAIVICITLIVVITSILVVSASKNQDNRLILKIYEDEVCLMKGDKVITEYDDIVIDVLPIYDRNRLYEGIIIENEEQLMSILEDYDG